MVKTTRVTAGEMPARGQGQGAGLLPTDPQAAGAGFHAHAVCRHALQDPAGDPAGHRLPVVGCLGDRSTEDGDVAVVVAADQPGYTYVQDAGVPGDGQVCESSFDVVTDPAALSAARAAEVDGHRVAVQVGDVAGVGGVVDAQAEFGGSADRVGDEVRGSSRRDGRVRHGSWSD